MVCGGQIVVCTVSNLLSLCHRLLEPLRTEVHLNESIGGAYRVNGPEMPYLQ